MYDTCRYTANTKMYSGILHTHTHTHTHTGGGGGGGYLFYADLKRLIFKACLKEDVDTE